MSDWLEERLIEATPNRIRQAREQNRVPRSRELVAAVVFATGMGILGWIGPSVMMQLQELLRTRLSATPWSLAEPDHVVAESVGLAMRMGRVVLPLFVDLMLAAVALSVVQSGWIWAPRQAIPDLRRANPAQGVVKLFSSVRLVESLSGSLKMSLIGAVCVWSVWRHRFDLLSVSFYEVAGSYRKMYVSVFRCCVDLALALIIFAIADYSYQWWNHHRGLRMTEADMREETRMREGDPMVRQRRDQLRRVLAQSDSASE